jgi:hypothetical protein
MLRRQPARPTKQDWPVLALFLTAGACALEEGTTPTSNTPPVVASDGPVAPPNDPGAFPPSILSPVPGTEVKSASPTLTVGNASLAGNTRTTYTFQVANDVDFNDMVAREQDVPPGDNGRTSWQVDKTLDQGRYFWRAYAQSGTTRLTSRIADFRVPNLAPDPIDDPDDPIGEPLPPTGPGTVIVFDPLTNFSSVGEVSGGAFTAGGWEVRDKRNYIRYHVPTLSSGYVEWSNSGLRPSNPSLDQYMLFGMWDPNRGDYRTNPFRVHIQKLDQNHNSPYVRLRWISNGEQHDVGNNFLGWDPTRLYRWRIQWGPSGSGNQVDVFLDGARVMSTQYGPAYAPAQHLVELGIAERVESIVGVRYSNLEIGSN